MIEETEEEEEEEEVIENLQDTNIKKGIVTNTYMCELIIFVRALKCS